MEQTKIDEIVSEWIHKGVHISQETVDYVLWYCERKMDVNEIENREEYLPLLFKDALKNYLFGQSINATTMLRAAERACVEELLVTDFMELVGAEFSATRKED